MIESRTLQGLLIESSRRFPDRTAVVDPGQGSATYATLSEVSDVLSASLRGAGVREGDRIGICAPKSMGAVASIFGILKAGAAYVPVDVTAPIRRSATIFQDCSVAGVIVHRPLVDKMSDEFSTAGIELMEVSDWRDPFDADLSLLAPKGDRSGQGSSLSGYGDLAYILYTSGSTGRPKGVMHTHSTALSFVDWCSQEFEPDEGDRFSSHAPFHFDLSILDIYVPIKHGGAIVLVGEEIGKQPLGLAELIAEERISVWYSTPSILRLLVEFGKLSKRDYPDLRLVLFAGEVFPMKHLKALREIWTEPWYYNLYGPTETNVCTFHAVSENIGDDQSLPIGKVCSGDQARVVDEMDRDVPAEVKGELLVSGGSVMVGYWNLPEQNDAAFLADESGVRWYRTGDVVVDDGKGCYTYFGRRDRMVKRRGYRVELGEIEAALYSHDQVSEAAVVAVPDEESGVKLHAFVAWSGDDAPSQITLKGFSSKNLPAYMIPDVFSFLEALPKTSTDKVDYQSLKECC